MRWTVFVKAVVDDREKTGKITFVVANEMGCGEEAFALSIGEVARFPFPIDEGSEVSEEIYDALSSAAERTGALQYSAAVLGNGIRSRKTLLYKLKVKGFSSESAEYALSLLEKKGYLCDKRACRDTAENLLRTKKYGRQRIITYLVSHGYASCDAREAVELLDEDELHDALAYNIDRKFPNIENMPLEDRQKAIRSLMRLGFSAGDIIKEVKNRTDRR